MNQDLIFALEASYKLGATDEKALISAYQQNPETIKMIDKVESEVPISYTPENRKLASKYFDKLKLGDPDDVGYIMEMFYKHKPTTFEEATSVWINNQPNSHEIVDSIVGILKEYEPNLSDNQLKDIFITGIIFNSFLGYSAEIAFIEQYNGEGVMRKPKGEIDNKYAVDLIVTKDKQILEAYQIKSKKSDKGWNYYSKRNWKKNVKFFEDWGIEVETRYYTWEYKNNKFNFKFD